MSDEELRQYVYGKELDSLSQAANVRAQVAAAHVARPGTDNLPATA
jgi:hypothetical protein